MPLNIACFVLSEEEKKNYLFCFYDFCVCAIAVNPISIPIYNSPIPGSSSSHDPIYLYAYNLYVINLAKLIINK